MRHRRIRTVVLLLALLLAWMPARPASADTITVDTTGDVLDAAANCGLVTIASLPGLDGVISLREAMCAANNNTGPDTIHFNITGCGGVCTIQPDPALPIVTDGDTTINGYSQPGTAQASAGTPATLLIEIDGTHIANNNGFNIISSGNVIRGLVINGFSLNGVAIGISAATDNVVSGNHIGTDASGTLDQGNAYCGVFIGYGAQNNTIGGSTAADRNVISGNDWGGVAIYYSSDVLNTTGNVVSGNYIGTDANGTGDLGNTSFGVYVYGGAQGNTVGGDAAGERNVISGNGRYGVRISGDGTTGNVVSGNYIGTDASGTLDLGNSEDGISIDTGAQNNTVGGDASGGEGNVISGNDESGVLISDSGTTGNVVSGNHIGTDASGTGDLGNSISGVVITAAAQGNTVGGDAEGERNVISGNDASGVEIVNTDTMSNTVSGNYIGTTADGTGDLGNAYFGVHLGWGVQNNTVGGDASSGEGNLISGNDHAGVRLYGENTADNTVSGNYIGLAADGSAELGNHLSGVEINSGPYDNTIGGDTPGERNVISGNGGSGVVIQASTARDNIVSGNYIGSDAAGSADRGNAEHGVYITNGAHSNTVGGSTPGERNVISGNDGDGIRLSSEGAQSNTVLGNYIGLAADGLSSLGNVDRGVHILTDAQNNCIGPGNVIAYNGYDGVEVNGSGTSGNRITQNSIFSNAVGIHLTAGANGGIAAPVILATTAGSVNIGGTACPGCSVEVFESRDLDGEGETYVGDTTAEASGAFTVTVDRLTKAYLTATSTDPASGTSEFSAVFTATVELEPLFIPAYLPIVFKNY